MKPMPSLLSQTLLPALLLSLTACGGSHAPQPPVIAPTAVAAVQTPPPEYPIDLACAGIGGISTLSVMIGTQGVPTEISVAISSGQTALDHAAQAAVRGWKFKPATRNGQPVPQSIQVPVNFHPPAERPTQCFALDSQNRQSQ